MVNRQEEEKDAKEMRERNDVLPNEEEVADYEILNREYFECRKAEFLLNRLIVPI